MPAAPWGPPCSSGINYSTSRVRHRPGYSEGQLPGAADRTSEIDQFPRPDRASLHHFATRKSCWTTWLRPWRRGKWAGSAAGWSSDRGPWGRAASLATPVYADAGDHEPQGQVSGELSTICSLRVSRHVHEWFGMRPGEYSPYMLMVAPVLESIAVHAHRR